MCTAESTSIPTTRGTSFFLINPRKTPTKPPKKMRAKDRSTSPSNPSDSWRLAPAPPLSSKARSKTGETPIGGPRPEICHQGRNRETHAKRPAIIEPIRIVISPRGK